MTSKAIYDSSTVNFSSANCAVVLVLAFVIYCLPIYPLLAQNEGSSQIELLDFQLIDLNGDTLQTNDLYGKVLVIDFWATWCAPCIKSFPAMMEVQHSYKDNKEVIFLYVNTLEVEGRNGDFISQFLDKKGIDLKVYLDRANPGIETLSEKLGISSLPYKIIVDKSGEIRYRDSGLLGGPVDFKMIYVIK